MEALVIGIGMTALFAGLLIFGFASGTMPSITPAFEAGDKHESPGRYWTLAGMHMLGLAAGVITLIRAI